MAGSNSTGGATTHGLWELTGTAPTAAVAQGSDVRTEVAIVGGGFCGLSAALHLAEAGIQATVLEAETPGFGASGRNGGQVIAGLKVDPRELAAHYGEAGGRALSRFGAETAELVFSLVERFQMRCEAHRDGWLQAGRSPAMLRAIGERAADLGRDGQDVEFVEGERLAELTGTRYHRAAMLDRRSGSVQPLSYARGLASAAEALGARVVNGARVTELVREDGGWRLETAGGAVVHARQVLIAANAYLGNLIPALRSAMIVVESIQVATDPLPPDLDRAVLPSRIPVSDLMDLGVYFRRDDAGRFVIGGSGSLTERSDPRLFDTLVRAARTLYPSLGAASFTSRWGGRLTLTRDHLPRLATLDDGLHVAYGCNGRGVALMTAMGKLAADRLSGADRSDLPIANLPPLRYPFHSVRLPAMMAVRRFRRLRRRFARA